MTEGRPIPSKQESEKSMLVGDKWFQIRLPCPCLEFLLNNISPIVLHFEWWKLFFSVICVCIRPSSSAASQLAKVLNSVYRPSHTAPHPLLCMNLGSFVSICNRNPDQSNYWCISQRLVQNRLPQELSGKNIGMTSWGTKKNTKSNVSNSLF